MNISFWHFYLGIIGASLYASILQPHRALMLLIKMARKAGNLNRLVIGGFAVLLLGSWGFIITLIFGFSTLVLLQIHYGWTVYAAVIMICLIVWWFIYHSKHGLPRAGH